jgi:hypothetical protein
VPPGTQVICGSRAILIILRQLHWVVWRRRRRKNSVVRMELFLNLCWLSLLAPSYFLWRQRSASPSLGRRGRSSAVPPLVFLCVLGCALVLLFPVISASDDLHAMRAEMEESSPGKRGICQVAGEKVAIGHGRGQNLSAVVAIAASLGLTSETWQESAIVSIALPQAPSILRSSRAPPASRLV